MSADKAASPVLCATCTIEWDPDDLDQVQPDGHFVCPLWTGEGDEHALNVKCTRCLDRHDPAETGNPMCGWCLDGHLAEYLAGTDNTESTVNGQDKAAFSVPTVRDAMRERIGNTLVERYVADILGIDLDVPVADVQRWMQNGPKWDRLLVDAMRLTRPDNTEQPVP